MLGYFLEILLSEKKYIHRDLIKQEYVLPALPPHNMDR